MCVAGCCVGTEHYAGHPPFTEDASTAYARLTDVGTIRALDDVTIRALGGATPLGLAVCGKAGKFSCGQVWTISDSDHFIKQGAVAQPRLSHTPAGQLSPWQRPHPAEGYENMPKVLCWILTYPKAHELKATSVNNSWGRHCPAWFASVFWPVPWGLCVEMCRQHMREEMCHAKHAFNDLCSYPFFGSFYGASLFWRLKPHPGIFLFTRYSMKEPTLPQKRRRGDCFLRVFLSNLYLRA